ncbi:hypothetical protein Q8A67_002723 [Cirrhinus molitorella]|uniref:Adrenomedullin n=1 Tax=Cirrhinus molitorella TaxID=172907 RepID=A0AA88QIJ0_9TELE|nr:hypothetical protein Q8A67_002723 [Cirrhinus molitorella]
MQLILQSIFCGCLLATIAPGVDSAKHDLKRSVPAALRILDNSQFVRPDDVKDDLRSHPSTDISIRTKQSNNSTNQSRRVGCVLGTCTVHVLAHRLHDLNNKLKIGNAPRTRRSNNSTNQSRRRGCSVGECTLNDLIQLHHYHYNRLKYRYSPADKTSSFGYGEQ